MSISAIANDAATTSLFGTIRPPSPGTAALTLAEGRSSATRINPSTVVFSTIHCGGLSGSWSLVPGSTASRYGGNLRVSLSRPVQVRARICCASDFAAAAVNTAGTSCCASLPSRSLTTARASPVWKSRSRS